MYQAFIENLICSVKDRRRKMDENNMNQFDSFAQNPENGTSPAGDAAGNEPAGNTDFGFGGNVTGSEPTGNTDFGFGGNRAGSPPTGNTGFGFDGNGAGSGDMNIFGDNISGGYEIKKKKSKKDLVIGISVAAVVVIAALVTGLYFILRKTPEEIIKNAVKDTFAETTEEGYSLLNDTLGLSEFSTEKADTEITYTIVDSAVPEYKNVGMTAYSSIDMTDEDNIKAAMGGKLEIGGEALSADVKFVDSVLYYAIPELSDKTYKLTADDLVTIIQDAANAASSGDGSAAAMDVDYSEIIEKFREVSETAGKNFKEKLVYEKAGSESVALDNGKSVKAKKYTMTVPKAAIKEYVNEYVTAVVDYANENITDDQWTEIGLTKDSFEQIANMVPAYVGMLVTKDIVVDYYVADGKLVKIASTYKVSGFAPYKITLDVQFMGDKFVTNDISAELTMSSGEDDSESTVSCYFDKTSENKDGKWTVSGQTAVKAADGDLLTLDYEQVFDSNTKDLTYTGKISEASTGEEILIDGAGNFSEINKGKSYTFDISRFAITDGDGNVALAFAGTTKAGDLGKTIEADADAVDFDEAAESFDVDKFNQIIDKWNEVLDFGTYYYGSAGEDTGSIKDGLGDDWQDADDTGDDYSGDTDFSDDEYQGIVMKTTSGYSIDIKEPAGYSRSYASEYAIDLYNYDNDLSDVYYGWDTYSSIEDDMKTDFDSRVDTYGSDSVKVIENGSVKLANGKTAQYQITSIAMYGSMIYYYDFYINLEGDEYYTVTVTSWKSADLLQDIVDKFMSDDVVVISK